MAPLLSPPRLDHLGKIAIVRRTILRGAGFGDLSTFVTTFRRVFGLAPRDYRATARRRTGESLPARDLS
jgi:methylphosphotriester-DNA--protein-cysteine methyltransferase